MAVTLAELHDTLKEYFGYSSFREKQESVMRAVLKGENTFILMPTGGGKSLCYQIPALVSDGVTIVISPLIALMKNQVDQVKQMAKNKNIASVLNSSLSKKESNEVKERLIKGETKLLYISPEFLVKEANTEFLMQLNICFVAIDEAHCISEWGHDFRPDYRNIKEKINVISQKGVPVMALTATATEKVQGDILKNLDILGAKVFKLSFNRTNLKYYVKPKTKETIKNIIRYIKDNPEYSGIIYCSSRKKVEEIANILAINDVSAMPYHAGLETAVRTRNQDYFLQRKIKVIVATIAFGMGIDKSDIRFVIHFDIPKSIESYYQETGRAGRDGINSDCIAYYSPADIEKMEKLMQSKNLAEQQKGVQLLYEIVAFAETADCRRKYLLKYFGETFDSEQCKKDGMCDNCISPKEQETATDEMHLFLLAIQTLKQLQKISYISEFLMGIRTVSINNFKHYKLPLFGKGEHKGSTFWKSLLKKAITEGLIVKEIETFGVLKLTQKGKKFIEKSYEVSVSVDHDYAKDSDILDTASQNMGKASTLDPKLYEVLDQNRKSLAKKMDIPYFVVFSDAALGEMATSYPTSIEELEKSNWVGKVKAKKYGESFIQLIKKYISENDVNKPDDIIIKSVANKSTTKIYIIQSVDRNVPLDEIAKNKGISFDKLLSEIEYIVETGTKLNLNYYIDTLIDADRQDMAYDYFFDSNEGSVEKAIVAFENELTEAEVRLMKLKFLLEYGF